MRSETIHYGIQKSPSVSRISSDTDLVSIDGFSMVLLPTLRISDCSCRAHKIVILRFFLVELIFIGCDGAGSCSKLPRTEHFEWFVFH